MAHRHADPLGLGISVAKAARARKSKVTASLAAGRLLKSMKGRAVASVNDIPEMRRAFAGLKLRPQLIT